MINLVLAWMLTLPFGDVAYAVSESPRGTVIIELPGTTIEVVDTTMRYQVIEGPGIDCGGVSSGNATTSEISQ